MARILRIRNWDENFENNRTRELKKMDWVPVPTKQDGDGYTELVSHENGAAHLGAWLAIVEVAAKCDPRGTLLRESGKPHDSASLSRISRLPASVFEEVIPRLLTIGWLETQDEPANEVTEIPQEAAAPAPQEGAASRAREERNGTEGNGTEGKESSRSRPRPAKSDFEIAEFMFSRIKAIAPNAIGLKDAQRPITVERWANEIRLMREQDGRAPPEIRKVFEWANRDSFWRSNILSAGKLRDKFDQLKLKMNGRSGQDNSRVGEASRDRSL